MPNHIAAKSASIQVIDRLRALLDALADEGGNASLKVLAAVTGLAPSTAFRILAAAQDNDLIQRDGNGRYTFGPRIQSWAQLLHGRSDLRAIARPVMAWLRDQVQETVMVRYEIYNHEEIALLRITPKPPLTQVVLGDLW